MKLVIVVIDSVCDVLGLGEGQLLQCPTVQNLQTGQQHVYVFYTTSYIPAFIRKYLTIQ